MAHTPECMLNSYCTTALEWGVCNGMLHALEYTLTSWCVPALNCGFLVEECMVYNEGSVVEGPVPQSARSIIELQEL